MSKLYAIGDVHGQREMLSRAHARIKSDRGSDTQSPVVHLGDLCDRGPDTRGVLDDVLNGMEAGEPWHAIRGNHEQLFLNFLEFEGLEDPRYGDAEFWLDPRLGGVETLASYNVEADLSDLMALRDTALKSIPARHVEFLRARPFFFEVPGMVCVHAGIRPGISLMQQNKEDLLWIRDPFLNDPRWHGRLVVHGHTPVSAPEHLGNRVNLDTGAAFGRSLTAAVFEDGNCFVLTDDGREPLRPG
ncbi:MAG: metallophosphoesterase [Pseudomonadota bacterium]